MTMPIQAQDQSKPTIVFLGASNTNTKQWNNGSYVTKLRDLGTPWSDLNLTNAGVDGVGAFTYANNPQLLSTRLGNFTGDAFFVMLGGNDFLQQFPLNQFRTNFDWVLSEIRNNTQKLVFVTNIIWSPLEVILPEAVVTLFEEYQQVIANTTHKYHFTLVDVFNVTRDHSDYYQDDFIHLNEEGHKAVAKSIDNQTRDEINKLLPTEARDNEYLGLILGSSILVLLIALIPTLRKYYNRDR